MAVIDSIVKQAGDSKKSMDWYRRKVQDATGSGTTARGLIRQGKATATPKFGIFNLFGYQAKTYGETYGETHGETHGEPSSRIGSVYDGIRLQSERLTAMGIIRDESGRYLRATINPDGTPGYVEVDPVDIEKGLTKDIGSQLSEAAVGELNIHMRTVMRKIGLNPTVFMSYARVNTELTMKNG